MHELVNLYHKKIFVLIGKTSLNAELNDNNVGSVSVFHMTFLCLNFLFNGNSLDIIVLLKSHWLVKFKYV